MSIVSSGESCVQKETGKKYSLEELRGIIRTLRSENGCPWDKKQTNESMIACLEEETGEVVAAVNKNDVENLCEELGDLLFQIVFYSQMAEEKGQFTLDDVIDGISQKMVRRHPNVFGDKRIESWEEGIDLWKKIKSEEKLKKA